MGSSVKKKKDKKKDFQKTQFKVGKAKAKPSNFTDTSFKAKSIVLGKQSISVNAPSSSAQFAHHVSLLRNRTDSQRSESLAYLTSAILSTPTGASLPEPAATLLPKLLPLVLDGSPAVRQQLLKLLKAIASKSNGLQGQAERSLLYIHAGMTHLSADIRTFSMDVLDWLLENEKRETTGCAGGWVKTLSCFMGLFGWQQQHQTAPGPQKGWSSQPRAGVKPGSQAKALSRQLMTFAGFLRAGIGSSNKGGLVGDPNHAQGFPLVHVAQHLIPQRSNAYAHLNLFGPPQEEEAQILEDREDRQRTFARRFQQGVTQGVDAVIKEGGDLGRAASAVRKVVAEGLADYEVDDTML